MSKTYFCELCSKNSGGCSHTMSECVKRFENIANLGWKLSKYRTQVESSLCKTLIVKKSMQTNSLSVQCSVRVFWVFLSKFCTESWTNFWKTNFLSLCFRKIIIVLKQNFNWRAIKRIWTISDWTVDQKRLINSLTLCHQKFKLKKLIRWWNEIKFNDLLLETGEQ